MTDGKSGRNADGRFGSGNSGKPRGTRHKATQAVLALLEGEAEALSRKAVEMALAGDGVALRLCLDRIAPPRKDSPVQFPMPRMANAHDAAQAAGAVLEAVAGGELTPVEGAQVMGLVDSFRRTLEVTELETRVAALEGGSKPTSPLGMVNSEVPPFEQGRSSRE
jgi:hypothetical protein